MSADPLQVLDPFLPLLASEAALEMDSLLLKQQLPTESAARQLANVLRVSFFDTETGTTSFVDSSVLAVVGGAMKAAKLSNMDIHTATQFRQVGKQLTDQLDTVGTASATADIKKLRAFCNQLSRFAIHFRQRLYPTRREATWQTGGVSYGAAAVC
jgi:hypothetical protein